MLPEVSCSPAVQADLLNMAATDGSFDHAPHHLAHVRAGRPDPRDLRDNHVCVPTTRQRPVKAQAGCSV